MTPSQQMSLAALEGEEISTLDPDERKLFDQGVKAGFAGRIIDPGPKGSIVRVIINNWACPNCEV